MPTLIDTRNAFRRLHEEGVFSEEQADAIVGPILAVVIPLVTYLMG